MTLNGGGIETQIKSNANSINTLTNTANNHQTQIQSIINGSSISMYARTFAKSEGTSWKKGSGMYYYEGSDTTAYDLPYPNVFVCSFYSNESRRSRGIAFALKWENSISPTIWTNSCHDDAGTGKWNGWNAIS